MSCTLKVDVQERHKKRARLLQFLDAMDGASQDLVDNARKTTARSTISTAKSTTPWWFRQDRRGEDARAKKATEQHGSNMAACQMVGPKQPDQ